MKTDFKKFRMYSRLSFMFMVLVVGAFLALIMASIVGKMVVLGIAFVLLFVFGGIGVVIECAAYDNLICPKCGNRIAKPLRESFTKENRALYRRIDRGESIECAHCGVKIETA